MLKISSVYKGFSLFISNTIENHISIEFGHYPRKIWVVIWVKIITQI